MKKVSQEDIKCFFCGKKAEWKAPSNLCFCEEHTIEVESGKYFKEEQIVTINGEEGIIDYEGHFLLWPTENNLKRFKRKS